MERLIRGRAIVPGSADGLLLVSREPLSFWGGYDPASGEIIDRRHHLSGQCARDRVLAVPSTRGSSTTTAILLEAIRAGTTPAAILTEGTDPFIALAAVVADEVFDRALPVVALDSADFASLRDGLRARVAPDGRVRLGEGKATRGPGAGRRGQ